MINDLAPPAAGRPAGPPSPRLPGVGQVMRRLPWAIAAAGLGLGLGALTGHLKEPVYQSTTYVTVTTTSDQADAESIARAAQALARIAATPEVISGPLRTAGLGDAAEQPRDHITAQAAPDAPLISITGVAADPQEAESIAATVGNTLAGVDTLGPFQAHEVTQPSLPTSPDTPGWVPSAGGAALGLGVGLVLSATVPPRRPRTAAGG